MISQSRRWARGMIGTLALAAAGAAHAQPPAQTPTERPGSGARPPVQVGSNAGTSPGLTAPFNVPPVGGVTPSSPNRLVDAPRSLPPAPAPAPAPGGGGSPGGWFPPYVVGPVLWGGPVVVGQPQWAPGTMYPNLNAYAPPPGPGIGYQNSDGLIQSPFAGIPLDPLDPAAFADPGFDRSQLRPNAPPPPPGGRASRRDRERAAERLKVGDRLFRAREFARASERYGQSIQADPSSAAAYVRLAQVAVARKDYEEAARRLREAQVAEPTWMRNAPDVQNLFGDPRQFAAVLADLESHLQAEPNDRDAWLVLGAELYLSGRTRRAADVFLRLSDRQPDETLAAFLQASRALR